MKSPRSFLLVAMLALAGLSAGQLAARANGVRQPEAGEAAGNAPTPPAVPAAQPASNPAEIYGRACAGCHGPKGGGGAGPPIAGRKDTEAIGAIVRDGRGYMPAMGGMLTSAEIEGVARHLAHLAK